MSSIQGIKNARLVHSDVKVHEMKGVRVEVHRSPPCVRIAQSTPGIVTLSFSSEDTPEKGRSVIVSLEPYESPQTESSEDRSSKRFGQILDAGIVVTALIGIVLIANMVSRLHDQLPMSPGN